MGEFEKRLRQHFELPITFKISTAETFEEATEEKVQQLMKIVKKAEEELDVITKEFIEREGSVYEDHYVQFYHKFKEWRKRWFK